MTVQFIPDYLSSGDKGPSAAGGAEQYTIVQSTPVVAADGNGDTYVVGLINGNDKPFNIDVFHDSITSGTDYDLGVYVWDAANKTLGEVVDKDLFADGLDLSTAADAKFALSAPAIENLGKTVHELLDAASITTNHRLTQYALVWTANTVGSADGDIVTRYTALKDA